MAFVKRILTLMVLASLIISMIGGISPAYATEPADIVSTDEAVIDTDVDADVYEDPDEPAEIIIDRSEEEPKVFSVSQDPVVDFVVRLYDLVLQRQPDPAGLEGWVNYLKSGTYTGAGVAYGFFFSTEMNARNLPAERYIEILYQTFLDRPFDQPGRDGWLELYRNGYTNEDLFAGFANSNEFGDLCAQAGIVRGTFIPPPGAPIRAFVSRLYRTTLLREPDAAGLEGWTDLLLRGTTGVSVAYGFVFSNEMRNRNLTNGQFVDVLYNAFLNRGADAPGRAFWVDRLDAGLPREDVFAGFANSNEFNDLSSAAGIVRGLYIPPVGGNVRVFITHMYKELLQRSPSTAENELWFEALRSNRETGASFANTLVFSDEMAVSTLSDTDLIGRFFRAFMDRPPFPDERNNWVTQLADGTSINTVFITLISSTDFDQFCRDHGVTRGTIPQQPGTPGGPGTPGTGALAGKIIILDPGHGTAGSPGVPGYNEAVTMLDLARRIRPLLQAHGAEVILTRDNEVNTNLAARCAMINIRALEAVRDTQTNFADINEINRLINVMWGVIANPTVVGPQLMNTPFNAAWPIHPDMQRIFEYQSNPVIGNNFLVISLHSNATADGSSGARGAEAWYINPLEHANVMRYYPGYTFANQSRHFGNILLNNIAVAGIPRRTNGLRADNMMISRETNVPSILVENGFHTNPSDRALLQSSPFLDTLAVMYMHSILQYFG